MNGTPSWTPGQTSVPPPEYSPESWTQPLPLQPPEKPPLWRRPWVVITGCVLVGLTGLGILGSTMEPTDVQEPQPTVTGPHPDSTWKAPATTVGGLAAPQSTEPTVTTPPPTEPSQRQQVAAWWSKAEADTTSLEQNSMKIGVMFTDDPYSVMLDPTEANILLRQLQEDVRNLKAHGPIPVPEVNEPWQKALRAYGKAFDLVYEGINYGDYEKVTRGAELMMEGNTQMGLATEELSNFNAG